MSSWCQEVKKSAARGVEESAVNSEFESPAPQDRVSPRVCIAVLTFRRPSDLAELLPQLDRQFSDAVDSSSYVLVVDNDEMPSAESIVQQCDGAYTFRYAHVATPGIAAARNGALDGAREADLLIFIDDDERPSADWLDALVSTYRTSRPAAVAGPVISSFAVTPDPWVSAGQYFTRRRWDTGTEIPLAATNNLLLDMAVIRRLDLRFDESLGLTGGEDTLFTRTLTARGGRIIWNNEAVVTDVVPENRMTRRWVIQRRFSAGNTTSLVALRLATSVWQRLALRLELTSRGGLRLVGGAGKAAWGWVSRSTSHEAQGVRTAARGLGMLAGAWGIAYREYKRQ